MQALILNKYDDVTRATLETIDTSMLPAGDVTVEIDYSCLNYKDALAITGKGKIIRQFPMVPGIDFAGRVYASEDPRFHPGQMVLLTGWGVGENHWGGLAKLARVNADWLVPMPEGLDARKAMIIGTAGFTAMLCLMALEEAGITPQSGEIVVTGASGGVGSTAIALLHHHGYQVAAVSGRSTTHQYLYKLGASRILSREDFAPARPLEKQLWAGAIDTVGGQMLATLLAQVQYGGCVAACGLAGGISLPATVMPFILRNVRLQGVDSVMAPAARRITAWERLSRELPASFYEQASTEISLAQAPEYARALIDNKTSGRTLVKID